MNFDVSALHLLRPEWLWALLALPVLLALWFMRRRRASVWHDVVDPHLLPHLLDRGGTPRRHLGIWIAALAYALAVLALAGPSWRQVEQPLWQGKVPLVIALDLSKATLAADPPPSRLAQARAKLAVLLDRREAGPVGLVVFADDAYTVAPLTEDAANVALFLDALSPDIMPDDGHRADRAIVWSARLMRQAGFDQGRILLMTDRADSDALAAAAKARDDGFEVDVLGLGREGGVPYRTPMGETGTAPFDEPALRSLAAQGGGGYARLSADDADLRALAVLDAATTQTALAKGEAGRTWQDEGYWLLPPLLLLALLGFRRGAAVAVLLVVVWLPAAPAHAQAVDWWQRDDQKAHEQLEQGTQAYRKGDFAAAAETYQKVDTVDGHYNRGNALAKAGRYQEAIDAYDRALAQQPGMADAIANKRAVEAAMKQSPKDGDSGDSNDSGSDQDPSKGAGGSPSPDANDPSKPSGEQDQSKASQSQSESDEPRDKPNDSSSDGEPSQGQDDPPESADPADADAQQAADQAQRERMQQALQQAAAGTPDESEEAQSEQAARNDETPAEREQRLANEAWLRRVPDDPGGLLREKFRIEHQRRRMQGDTGE